LNLREWRVDSRPREITAYKRQKCAVS
jgi:hypothetical protein